MIALLRIPAAPSEQAPLCDLPSWFLGTVLLTFLTFFYIITMNMCALSSLVVFLALFFVVYLFSHSFLAMNEDYERYDCVRPSVDCFYLCVFPQHLVLVDSDQGENVGFLRPKRVAFFVLDLVTYFWNRSAGNNSGVRAVVECFVFAPRDRVYISLAKIPTSLSNITPVLISCSCVARDKFKVDQRLGSPE